MSDDERASIIITTYYRNQLLPDAIESALAQTYDPVEVFIVDGSGEAHAEAIVKQYDDVTYIPQKSESSLQSARTVGFERATGRYIQFLDDDDFLYPDKLRRQIPLFNEDVGVVYSGLDYYENDVVVLPDEKGNVLSSALAFDLYPPCSFGTRLHDSRILKQLAPFDDVRADDDWTMIQLARRTKFDFVNEPLITYRIDTDYSLGSSPDIVDGKWHVIDAHEELYEQYPPRIRKSAISDIFRSQGRILLNENGWSPSASRAFLLAAYHTPDNRVSDLFRFFVSIFGRTGWEFGSKVYQKYVV